MQFISYGDKIKTHYAVTHYVYICLNSDCLYQRKELFSIGATDIITKSYIRENEVFADAFNYFMYDGAQVIQPNQLRELDPTELAILFNPHSTKDRRITKPQMVQKYRDHLKSAVFMEDGTVAYALLGIENQTQVHYAMPIRNMLYDAMQYSMQADAFSAAHHHSKDKSTHTMSHAEFLSGFCKDDKLIPVITLVLFFNADNWDGARSLMDMMDIPNPTIRQYVQDYKIHLIHPQQLPDTDLCKFHSSLREVMGCIKYSKDKDKLLNFIHNNPRMNMETAAARVIEAVTHTPIEIKEGAERVDMCKAIEDLIQDSKLDGKAEGRLEASFELLTTLIQSQKVTLEEAADLMNMTPDEFIEKQQMISQ